LKCHDGFLLSEMQQNGGRHLQNKHLQTLKCGC